MRIPLCGSAANPRLSIYRVGRRVYLSRALIREGSGAFSNRCRPVPMGAFVSSGEDMAFHRRFESPHRYGCGRKYALRVPLLGSHTKKASLAASPQSDRSTVQPKGRSGMNNLTCKCVPRLDGVSAAELGRLFPEPSNTAPLLSLLQESGIDGFNLRSIVVLKDDAPILLLPLFKPVLIYPLLWRDGSRNR